MLLKNQAVLVTDEDGEGVNLTDDPEVLSMNTHNILNWDWIISQKIATMQRIRESLVLTEKEFRKFYNGDIED